MEEFIHLRNMVLSISINHVARFEKKPQQIKLYWVVGKRVRYSDWEKII